MNQTSPAELRSAALKPLPLSLEIRGEITSWVPAIDILFFKQQCDVPIKLKTVQQNDLEYPAHV